MALNIGELVGYLRLDDSQFDRGLDRNESKMKAFGGFLVKAGAAGATALGTLAVAGGAMGLSVAAGNEQAQISFETMLGSAKRAGAFLEDLKTFAAATPFEFPELQTAASSLISAGIEANKVIPIMTTLGDVTSGMGTGSEGVKRATVALQQMAAAGRITGEDLNQLRDAGIPVYDLLSKATGKSKEEVVALAQAGKLGSKELGQMMKALETGKGLERFSGLMEKQSGSLTGMWSTFKDVLGQNLADAITPLIPLIKDGLGGASDFLADVLPKASDAMGDFIEGMQNGTGPGGQFVDVLGDLKDGFDQVYPVVVDVIGWLIDNWETVGTFAGVILTVVGAIKVWTIAQAALNVVLTANPIGIVVVALAALAAGLVYAYKHSETFRDIVDGAFHAVGEAAKWLWNNAIQPTITFIINGYAMVFDAISKVLEALSHVPGFGWAGKAADAMARAADKAREMADGINKIPDSKDVHIRLYETTIRSVLDKQANDPRGIGIPHGATGGIVTQPTLALIGEAGPEAVVPLNRTPGSRPLPDATAGGRPRRVQLVIGNRAFDAYVRELAGEEVDSALAFEDTLAGRHH